MTIHLQLLVRRPLTRVLGFIPSMAVVVLVGRSGINTMLIASQVVLSIELPSIIFLLSSSHPRAQ